jgi:hypothetical protein
VTPIAGGGRYAFSGVTSGIDPFAADLRGCQLARPADGGVLVSECVGPYALARVRYLAPAAPERLAVGISASTLAHTEPQQIAFTLSQPATASVEVTAPGRAPWSTQVQAAAGPNTVAMPGVEVPPAAQVRVVATAPGAHPATVSDTVRVRWSGTLSTADASTAVRGLYPNDYDRPTDRSCRTVEGCTYLDCRQMTATRVDCGETSKSSESGRRRHCHGIMAVRLQPDGSLTGRLYDWTAIENDPPCRFRLAVEDPGIDHDYYVVGWSDDEMPLLG